MKYVNSVSGIEAQSVCLETADILAMLGVWQPEYIKLRRIMISIE